MPRDLQKPLGSGFNNRSTARDVLQSVDVSGKQIIVTGGYSGIGLEAVKALSEAGAQVTVPVRNRVKADKTLASVANVTIADMDLGDLQSVRRFAEDFANTNQKLDVLINNAGIMACPEKHIGSNWESQFATNHIGHFVLVDGLLPLLKKAGQKEGARIISLSSTAHRVTDIRWDDIHFENGPYEKWTAYGQSKTANSLFAIELDKRHKSEGVRAFAVHPGGIMTPLQRHLDKIEMVALGWIDEAGEIAESAKNVFKSPEAGAATSVWCATSPSLDGYGGVYCEDCDIAQLAAPDGPRYFHVAGYAVDEVGADRLWTETEKMIA